MVKIPRIEQQLDFQPSKRVVEGVRTPVDDGIAQGLMKLGQAGVEIAGRIQHANLEQELVKADTELRVRMDKAKYAIESDPTTPIPAIGQRWKQESEAIISELSGTISSARARDQWLARARGVQGEGDVWSSKLQLGRQVDKVSADYAGMYGAYAARAGDATVSPETYANETESLKALVASHRASGWISEEVATKRLLEIDGSVLKDRQVRLSDEAEALVRAGDEAGAKALLETVGDAPTRKLVEAAIKGTKNEIDAEIAKRDKEVRDAQIKYSNEMEVGILKGQIRSQRDIDTAVSSGQIHVNDAPALMRALNEEQERIKRDAERAATMSPAQKRALEEASADTRLAFLTLMMTPNTRGLFASEAKDWPQDMRDMYASMTGEDQRWVDTENLKLRTTGVPATAATKTFNELWDVAVRWAPDGWMLRSNAQDALNNPNNQKVRAALLKAADEITPTLNGLPLQKDRAEQEIIRVLRTIDPKMSVSGIPFEQKARVNAKGLTWAAGAIDWTLWNKIKAAAPPTASNDDVMAAYIAAGGKAP